MGVDYYEAYDFDSIVVSTVAVGLTAAKLAVDKAAPAARVEFRVGAEPVRYRYDGTDPTSTSGAYVPANTVVALEGYPNIRKLKFIKDTTAVGDSSVDVHYLR